MRFPDNRFSKALSVRQRLQIVRVPLSSNDCALNSVPCDGCNGATQRKGSGRRAGSLSSENNIDLCL